MAAGERSIGTKCKKNERRKRCIRFEARSLCKQGKVCVLQLVNREFFFASIFIKINTYKWAHFVKEGLWLAA